MIVVATVSLLALLLTVFDSRKIIDFGLKAGFVMTTILVALHYDYGNDYMMYFNRYTELMSAGYTSQDLLTKDIIRNGEFGWSIINILFMPFGRSGFFLMVAALACLQNWIYYHTIKTYVKREWWWLAIFIYLFVTNIYVLSFSMMRQSLAIALCVLMLKWIYEKKTMLACVGILLTTTIHASVIIMLPWTFIGLLPTRKHKLYAIIIAILFTVLVVFRDVADSIFVKILTFKLVADYNNLYGEDSNTLKIGIGFAINMISLLIVLYYLYTNNRISKADTSIVMLYSFGFIVLPFTLILPLIARVMYYFTVFSVLALPITYSYLKNNLLRISCTALFMLMTLYDYMLFFQQPIWIEKYTTYQTIFSAL